jgi:hydrogenase nickel incorporation protein HypA/HybF
MHEFSITSQLVESVIDEARRKNAKRVLEVHLIIGSLTLLGVSQIRFAYKLLTQDNIMKDSRLYIRHRKGKVRCDKCGYKGDIMFRDDPLYHTAFPTLTCPKCDSTVKIIQGKECVIKSIRMYV